MFICYGSKKSVLAFLQFLLHVYVIAVRCQSFYCFCCPYHKGDSIEIVVMILLLYTHLSLFGPYRVFFLCKLRLLLLAFGVVSVVISKGVLLLIGFIYCDLFCFCNLMRRMAIFCCCFFVVAAKYSRRYLYERQQTTLCFEL